MSNMREISVEECMRVSGGIIIVNGSPPSTPPNPGPDNSAMQGAWMYLGMNSSSINYTSLYGQGRTLSENSGIGVTGEWNPDGDDDNDDISNMDEEIVVTGNPQALKAAMDSYRNLATAFVNYFLYSGVAMSGFAGLTGRAGAAIAVGTAAGFDLRDKAIEDMAQALFDSDADDDGVVNGSIWRQGLHPDVEPGVVYYP